MRSYRPVSPLPAAKPGAGGLFSVALSLGLPPPAVDRHRIPVEPGLSSNPRDKAEGQRPSGRLVAPYVRTPHYQVNRLSAAGRESTAGAFRLKL